MSLSRKYWGITGLIGLVLLPVLASATIPLNHGTNTVGIAGPFAADQSEPQQIIRQYLATHRQPMTVQAGEPYAAVDACVEQEMNAGTIPGAVVAVIDQGNLVYEQGYGLKNLEQGGNVDPDTLFRFGSILKMMTASAVLQQAELGRVDIDAPVTRYIPEFTIAGPAKADDIKVWNLISHSTTFPDRYSPNIFDITGPTTPTALSDWAAGQGDIPLFAVPGAFWNYSNPNFSLAGLVVERASGQEYHDYMSSKIFSPAGMTATTLLPAQAMATGNYSFGHYQDLYSGELVIAAPDAYDNWSAAPAGFGFTRARDLAQFALLLMNGGGNVLKPESAEALQGQQIDLQVSIPLFYGYGVLNYPDYKGLDIRWHNGALNGWTASLMWIPARKFAVAVLFNGMGNPDNVSFCSIDALLKPTGGQPPDTSRDPSEWGRYEGRYTGRFYGYWNWKTDGEMKIIDGEEMEATVTKEAGQLLIDLPLLGMQGRLEPIGKDNFILMKVGQAVFDFTFIDDPAGTGQVKWLRNRAFVLEKQSSSEPCAGLAVVAMPPNSPAGLIGNLLVALGVFVVGTAVRRADRARLARRD